MKTKFSELLKIKKQKVSEIEQELAQKRHEKQIMIKKIEALKVQISTFEYPKQGDYSQMRIALSERDVLLQEKEHKENMIKYFDQEIEKLNILYKDANIEYEKIKHLHEIEVEKKVAQMQQEEAKNLDEIGNQLFIRNQKKETFA